MQLKGIGGKIEALPSKFSAGAKKLFKSFSVQEHRLLHEISKVQSQLKRLLKHKKKHKGLIRRLKRRLRILKAGLRALRAKRAKATGIVNKGRTNLLKGVRTFSSKWQAKDALYGRAKRMLKQFPKLKADFKFLNMRHIPRVPAIGLSSMAVLSFVRAKTPQPLVVSNIQSINDPNILLGYLGQVRANRMQLLGLYRQGNIAMMNQVKTNQILRTNYVRFHKLSIFAKGKAMFHRAKSALFRGFAKVLRFVAKGLELAARGLEMGARALRALANAATAIPVVGPAIAAALRAMAAVMHAIAQALRMAAKVLRNFGKYMRRLSRFLAKIARRFVNKFKQLKQVASKFFSKLKQGIRRLNDIRKKLFNDIRNKLAQTFKTESQIIQRLRQLGEKINPLRLQAGLNPMMNVNPMVMNMLKAQMIMSLAGNLMGSMAMLGMMGGFGGFGGMAGLALGMGIPMIGAIGSMSMMSGFGGFGGFGGGFGGFGGGFGGFGRALMLAGAMGTLGSIGTIGALGMMGGFGGTPTAGMGAGLAIGGGLGLLGGLAMGGGLGLGPAGMMMATGLMGAMGPLGLMGMMALGPGFGMGMALGGLAGLGIGMGIGALRARNIKKRYEQRMLKLADQIIELRRSNEPGSRNKILPLQRQLLALYQFSISKFEVDRKVQARVQQALDGMVGIVGTGGAFRAVSPMIASSNSFLPTSTVGVNFASATTPTIGYGTMMPGGFNTLGIRGIVV